MVRRFPWVAGVAVLLFVPASGVAATGGLSVGSAKQFVKWTGPIAATIAPDASDDPTATYSILVNGDLSGIERTDGTGPCTAAAGETALDCKLSAPAAAGTYALTLQNDLTGDVLDAATVTVSPHLQQRVLAVAPRKFTPFKRDGNRDKVKLTFAVNKRAYASFQVRNKTGRIVRHSSRVIVEAGNHAFTWGGKSDRGRMVRPNRYYWLRLISTAQGEKFVGNWFKVQAYKAPPPSGPKCTAGYSPCLVYHGGADYDCAGGSGNGPYFTAPGVTYSVTGSDPYRLDSDNDGKGCEGSGGGGGGGSGSCTAGYDPCLVYHGGADYDCAGGGGNGPYFTKLGVKYRVTGSDPYRLDGNNNGWGCE